MTQLISRLRVSLGGVGVGLALLMQGPAAFGVCRAELGPRLDALANRADLRAARLGIVVETQAVNPDERRSIYGRDLDRYFVPASNIKLFTTAAALQRLGPGYTTRTAIYGNNSSGLTTLHVVGRGDPSLREEQLADLSQQIAQRGLTRVNQLIGYDGYFPGPTVHPDWEWVDMQYGYGAGVNALMVAENELVVRIAPRGTGQPLALEWVTPPPPTPWLVDNVSQTVAGGSSRINLWRSFGSSTFRLSGQMATGGEPRTLSMAIHQPAEYFLGRLQQQLQAAGVTVGQTSVSPQATASVTTELAAITSTPLSDWIRITNQRSNNQYAEAILKTLGVVSGGTESSAIAAGTDAVQSILQPLGVNPQTYQIADGSGLSRHNLATPQSFVDLLQAMANSPHASTYRASLAVAGDVGTLRNRFRNTAVAGRLVGKTGALSNNVSLSGYLNPPNHPPVVLSILLNNIDQPGSGMRAIIDEIVQEIAQLDDC
ncbi:MAG: D-alanyl-D-alanine carboxypeptidase/D-alanyl-D-alanine-endopeptidase [Cyanobacteria bacterium P01_A01_bin.105]